jgi:hypothetical protein
MAHRGGNPVVDLQHWTNHRISHPVIAVAEPLETFRVMPGAL